MSLAFHYMFLSLLPVRKARLCPILPWPLPCLGVFRSTFLFLCRWTSGMFYVLDCLAIGSWFFLCDWCICIYTLSLDPLFLTLCKFQAWDRLWNSAICSPRGGVGVRMRQKSRSKFLPWLGLEPRTSHLAVQHTNASAPRTPMDHRTPHDVVFLFH